MLFSVPLIYLPPPPLFHGRSRPIEIRNRHVSNHPVFCLGATIATPSRTRFLQQSLYDWGQVWARSPWRRIFLLKELFKQSRVVLCESAYSTDFRDVCSEARAQIRVVYVFVTVVRAIDFPIVAPLVRLRLQG